METKALCFLCAFLICNPTGLWCGMFRVLSWTLPTGSTWHVCSAACLSFHIAWPIAFCFFAKQKHHWHLGSVSALYYIQYTRMNGTIIRWHTIKLSGWGWLNEVQAFIYKHDGASGLNWRTASSSRMTMRMSAYFYGGGSDGVGGVGLEWGSRCLWWTT